MNSIEPSVHQLKEMDAKIVRGQMQERESTDMTLIFKLVLKEFYGYVGLCYVVSALEIPDVYGQ